MSRCKGLNLKANRPKRVEVITPHPFQAEILDDPARFKVVAAGRRVGKTQMMIRLIVERALRGEKCLWLSPTQKSYSTIWSEVTSSLAEVTSYANAQLGEIRLISGGSISLFTFENVESVRGRAFHLAVADEAGMWPKLGIAFAEVILPTLADYKGSFVAIGTPKGANAFKEFFDRGRDPDEPDWKSWSAPTTANPYIDPAEVELARRQIDTRTFEQEYLCVFHEDAGGVFRRVGEAIVPGRRECPWDHDDLAAAGRTFSWGIDLAQKNDFTVAICLDDLGRMVDFRRFNRVTTEQMIRRLRDAMADWPGPAIVDATGFGSPILERLKRAGCPVIGFQFTNRSKRNVITALSAALDHKELELFDLTAIKDELASYEYKETPTGMPTYSAPRGKHDDVVIALALAVRAMRSCRKPRIVGLGPGG